MQGPKLKDDAPAAALFRHWNVGEAGALSVVHSEPVTFLALDGAVVHTPALGTPEKLCCQSAWKTSAAGTCTWAFSLQIWTGRLNIEVHLPLILCCCLFADTAVRGEDVVGDLDGS